MLGTAVFLGWASLSQGASLAWPWVAAGFVANALVVGPLARSAVARRLGDSLSAFAPPVRKAVGVAVMLLVIFVFVWVVPDRVGRAVAAGGCAFIALSLAANAVLAVDTRNDATPN